MGIRVRNCNILRHEARLQIQSLKPNSMSQYYICMIQATHVQEHNMETS